MFKKKVKTEEMKAQEKKKDIREKKNPEAFLKEELAKLGYDMKLYRTTTAHVSFKQGDAGGFFNVTADGDIGMDEAVKILEKAKKEFPAVVTSDAEE